MSLKTEKLDRLMEAARAEKAPAEVAFEIIRAAADAYQEEAEGDPELRSAYPVAFERRMTVIRSMRDQALTLVNLFGGHHADAAWIKERAELPWWKRVWAGTTASQEFRSRWSAEMRAYGRQLVAEALS